MTKAAARNGGNDLAGDWSNEFVYSTVDSSLWGATLDATSKGNRGLVVLPVSWVTHEVAPGRFDFSTGSLGLRRLLDLGRARGARICLRIGGSRAVPIDLPARLGARRSLFAEDARGALVRVPGDATRFVPSAASTEGLRERTAFLDAVGAVASEAISAGLRVTVDCGGVLRALAALGPFDADYHPASRALYWTFLEGRYGDIRELNDEYGTTYATFSSVVPPTEFVPRAPGDLPAHFDWAAYQEYYRLWGAVRLKEAFAKTLEGAALTRGDVKWACVVSDAAVPVSLEELRRFFDHVAIEGAPETGDSAMGGRVAFAMPREYARLEWISTRSGVAVPAAGDAESNGMRWDEFGFLDDVPAATREARAGWASAFAACGVPWVEVEASVAAIRRVEAALVVVPTFDFISVGTWRVIDALVRDGRTVVVGLRVPWLSAALKPFGEFRAALKRSVATNDVFDEFRFGRGRLCVVKGEGASGDAGQSVLRRALRAILPKSAKDVEHVSA